MTSYSIIKLITVFLYKNGHSGERRELIKSEWIEHVTALHGLNP